jgi:hypothetical protein
MHGAEIMAGFILTRQLTELQITQAGLFQEARGEKIPVGSILAEQVLIVRENL